MILGLVAAAALAAHTTNNSLELHPRREGATAKLSPGEMFAFAEIAQRKNDVATAEAAYRALTSNPMLEVRNEARFRLAMLLVKQKRLTDGAVLLRDILDEQPSANRVRLELAAVLATMGDEKAAWRELRAARAGGLPPEVLQQVDRFSMALRARKRSGGSLQLAIASDSNINRATRSDTLGTVIGDFTLNEDARAQSGRGLSVQGQTYSRIPLGSETSLLGTVSGSGNFYRKSRFDDATLAVSVGPELTLGRNRVRSGVGGMRRWYGRQKFTDAVSVRVDLTRPFVGTAQLTGSAAANRIWNYRNALESGWSYSGSLGFEKALSTKSGAGISLTGIRQSLRDPSYSASSAQVSIFGYREMGPTTLTAAFMLGRLEADRRLLLYLDRRNETTYRASLSATARQLRVGGFAPTVTVTWERNRSPIEIYDYRRTAFNLGVTRAF